MKIKNIFVGLVLMTLTFTSCNSWFDVSSSTIVKGKDIFKTEQGFKDVFTGVYTLMTTKNLYGQNLSYGYNDVRAKYWLINSNDHDYFKVMSYKDKDEEKRISRIWNSLYKAISNVNSILANIDNDKSIFAPKMHSLYKGEAYALRAMLHFEVLRLYGVSPSAENAMNTKTIPYYETFTNIAQPQLTMKSVIDKIRIDINAARELLLDADPYGPSYDEFEKGEIENLNREIRMNYWAATALLARVELYGDYKNAAFAAAQEIIGEPNSTPNMPLSVNKQNSSSNKLFSTEFIFNLDIKTLKDMKEGNIPEEMEGSSETSLLKMNETILDKIYEENNIADMDWRKELWFKTADNDNFTLAKFDRETLIPIFKLSEVYYIAAECAPTSTISYEYMNNIRAGRGLGPVYSNLERLIQSEYEAEFVGEGQLFYFYKRKGLIGIGFEDNNSVNITLEQYILPFPKSEIEFGKVE